MVKVKGVPRIAILATPGMGHLIPLSELATRLLRRHGISSTLILPTVSSSPPGRLLSVLQSLPPAVDHVFLPPPSFDDIPSKEAIAAKVFLVVQRSLPSIRQTLKSMKDEGNLQALIVSQFATDAFAIAEELGVPRYMYLPGSASCLSILLFVPTLVKTVHVDFKDFTEPLRIPGCALLRGRDMVDPLLDSSKLMYSWYLKHVEAIKIADGVIFNSFTELEPDVVQAIRNDAGNPPVYPIGPLVTASDATEDGKHPCLEWLMGQPRRSVLFVSLGSAGTLSTEQLKEMAFGLETSNRRFLWVARPPNDVFAFGAYHDNAHESVESFLPEGFIERVKGRGLVVPNWAPQMEILSSGAIGGFLTHCGWNSILEALVNSVPMIVWPMFAEQKANAVFLVHVAMLALMPAGVGELEVVVREEIAGVVTELMEGEGGKRVRLQAVELGRSAVVAAADGGASDLALAEFARILGKNVL